MPLSVASLIPSFSALGSCGLTTIALTFFAIRSRMSASCPAALTLWWMTVTDLTSPDAAAWALAEQIDASRQPFPVPAPLAKPIVYLAPPAAPDAPAPPVDGEAVELQAPTTAIAATATRPRANPIRFMDVSLLLCPARAPSWALGRFMITRCVSVRRSVIHLLAGRSHGRVAA